MKKLALLFCVLMMVQTVSEAVYYNESIDHSYGTMPYSEYVQGAPNMGGFDFDFQNHPTQYGRHHIYDHSADDYNSAQRQRVIAYPRHVNNTLGNR